MKKIIIIIGALIALLCSHNSHAAITGPLGACAGDTVTLVGDSATSAVGTWSSSNPTVASVSWASGATGEVYANSPGTAIITFTWASGVSTRVFTVSAAPAAITGGATPFCVGTTVTLNNTVAGGVWSSGSSGTASVGAATGVVTGVSGGTASIYYTMGVGCYALRTVTVTGVPYVDSVVGSLTVCAGSTTPYSCVTPGGVWSSSSPVVATVNSAGVVTGVSAGSAVISYSVSGACGTGVRTRNITVVSSISAGSITGTATVAISFTTTLSSTVGGGTWSSGNPAVATISSGGVVTGVSAGTAVITYTKAGCSGPVYATTIVTVTVANCISGDVLFTGSAFFGSVKVWLIKYNPSTLMLTAYDSVTVTSSGTSAHYAFCGMGTDSFRVKAFVSDTMGATGYQPTYHTSSAYWSSAAVVYHVSGTHDMGKNITMGYGTVTSGPGFIAGDVTMGANKGTAGGVPAVNMLIYCVNNTSGTIIQKTYTDATGHYSFSNLPVGLSYKIYPELINYATTPYAPLTLIAGSSTISAANFEQHTLSHTITPLITPIIITGVSDIMANGQSISVFPNPAKGFFNVQWNTTSERAATVSVADITGRNVLSTTVVMTAGTGSIPVELQGISKGLYVVSVRAAGINYNTKIEVQ